jgi:hypothetical protein
MFKIKSSFEDNYSIIISEIKKKRYKWCLTSLNWLDYDDVSQQLLLRIYTKWHLFDPKKGKLEIWLSRVITNFQINLARNEFYSFSRPCLKCAARIGELDCRIFGTQDCSTCPLLAKWSVTKKNSHDIKIPVSLASHEQEVFNTPNTSLDIDATGKLIHTKMVSLLSISEYFIYKSLYIDHISENQLAKKMTNNKPNTAALNTIRETKKVIIAKVKELLYTDQIDYIQ